jgi:hypothetical protein
MAHRWEECTTYMGAWDVMSAHYVDRNGPPPGLSSFTKIRLGWISPEQVVRVRPGETREIALSPLAENGKFLAVRIPLSGGRYYLVENRQPIRYDSALPDSGILVVMVDPNALEGTGTARIMDADPSSSHFQHATYRHDRSGRKKFIDKENGVAVIALGAAGKKRTVVVTTQEKAAAY